MFTLSELPLEEHRGRRSDENVDKLGVGFQGDDRGRLNLCTGPQLPRIWYLTRCTPFTCLLSPLLIIIYCKFSLESFRLPQVSSCTPSCTPFGYLHIALISAAISLQEGVRRALTMQMIQSPHVLEHGERNEKITEGSATVQQDSISSF